MTAENPDWNRSNCLPGREVGSASACSTRSTRSKSRSTEPEDGQVSQPASRTRFYLDKRDGKVLGVCAGIADYTGIDVTMVRLMVLVSLFISGGSILPVYFIAGFMAPDQPHELDHETPDERQFWQGVRASPGRSARATSAAGCGTSTGASPTSNITSPPRTAAWPARSTAALIAPAKTGS